MKKFAIPFVFLLLIALLASCGNASELNNSSTDGVTKASVNDSTDSQGSDDTSSNTADNSGVSENETKKTTDISDENTNLSENEQTQYTGATEANSSTDSTNTTTQSAAGSTENSTSSSSSAPTYSQFPNVPDFGKMLNIGYKEHNDRTYIYSAVDVAKADPQGKSGQDYANLLKKFGFEPVGTIRVDKVTFNGYENTKENTTVLFGPYIENGLIYVTILKNN